MPKLSRASIALLLLLLINLMNYVDRQILSAVEKSIGTEFNVGPDQTGRLATAFLISYMIFAPVFGRLADQINRWLIVGAGVLIWSIASGGSGLVGTYALLLVMRVMVGVGEAAYGPVAPTIISDLYPAGDRGKVLAWFYAAIPVGSALGYVIGGLLTAHWRWAFYLTLPPGLALGVWALFMKDTRPALKPTSDQTVAVPPRSETYASLLRNRSYVLDTAGMAMMTFAVGGIAFFMPRWLESRGLKPEQATPIFGGVVVLAGLAATLLGGIAGDRLRKRFDGAYFLVSGAAMVIAFPLFLLMLITPFPACWLIIFATVFCLFFNTGPSNAIIANVTTPSIRATAFAVNIFIIHLLGDAASPPAIGWVARHSSLDRGFLVVSATIFIGGVCWLLGARFLQEDTLTAERATALT